MATKMENLVWSTKFNWKIENFSKSEARDITSDVFSVGSFKWKAQIYPEGSQDVEGHVSLYLLPIHLSVTVETDYSFAVACPTDPEKITNLDGTTNFDAQSPGYGWKKFMAVGEFHKYLVEDSCVIMVEVTCYKGKKVLTDGSSSSVDVTTKSLGKKIQNVELDQKPKAKDGESSKAREYPGAGQPFQNVNKIGFSSNWDYEDVGGFSVLKTQAPLYKQIWQKYGHIASTKVIPISSYSILVMMVKDVMESIRDMQQCRYIDLSSKMIEHWEQKINMAESNKFNIGWLLERFENVKKGMDRMGGMQKFKTELLENSQPVRAAKSKVKAAGYDSKKAEAQVTAAKNYVRETIKISGIPVSTEELETYLDIGEDSVLDGLF